MVDLMQDEITTRKKKKEFSPLLINIVAIIVIAALFAGLSYYYQNKQLSSLEQELGKVKAMLASVKGGLVIPEKETNKEEGQVISHGSREKAKVALTFDADMTKTMKEKKGVVWYNKEIIDILNKNKTAATFFLTGMWAETYPDQVKKIASNELFEIGNHSYETTAFESPCFNLAKLKSKEEKITSVNKSQEVIKNLTGEKPKYFRFPGGCYSKEDVALVNNLGLKVIQWDVVSGDAFAESASLITNHTLSEAKNGSIIVMHLGGPNAPYTAQALTKIIPKLQERFELVTISNLLSD